MLVTANLEKSKVDYIDLYQPSWGIVNGKYYKREEVDDAFPQPMLVHIRGKSHFFKQLSIVCLIGSPPLLLLYGVFIEQTMFILQPVKGGVYNILLLGFAAICLPSMLVTIGGFFYTGIERRWFIVSQRELKYLDRLGYGFPKIFTTSFDWKDVLLVEFKQGTVPLCVWDLIRWNPVWPVPNWEIRIKVKEYYWDEYITQHEREKASYHYSLSLGSVSERDIQELHALFSALVPADTAVFLTGETASAS